MYTVVGTKKNRSFRVLWMLEELGEAYEVEPEGPRSDRVRALNPTGKVPVLIDGDTAITDSAAILTFLADRHGKFTAPAGSIERARQDSVLFFANDDLDGILWMAARHGFILPEEYRVPDVKRALRYEWGRSMNALAEHLGDNPFVAGEQMTVPDFIVTHCLRWARNAKFDIPDGPIADYLARMNDRAALKRVEDM